MQWIWRFSSSLAGAPEQYAALLERARFRLVNDIDGVKMSLFWKLCLSENST